MGNFGQKIDKFIEIFLEQNGYVRVLEGLQNTLLIAITGLIIGILIGTLIATVRVVPKYKRLPRILNGICGFYVALFRGTPIVVQLLVFYYVLLPMMGVRLTGYPRSPACRRIKRIPRRSVSHPRPKKENPQRMAPLPRTRLPMRNSLRAGRLKSRRETAALLQSRPPREIPLALTGSCRKAAPFCWGQNAHPKEFLSGETVKTGERPGRRPIFC